MAGVNFGTYESSRDKKQGDKSIIVNIFFDGTSNNRKNTRARVAKEKKNKAIIRRALKLPYNKDDINNKADNPDKFIEADDKDTSYYNDETNVSRLEEYVVQDQEKVFSIYIEGVGTLDYGEDQSHGYGYGSKNRGSFTSKKDTGILGKVKIGCIEVLKRILKSIKDSSTVDLTFNVFGFSRGAAAARNFVYEVGFANMREDNNKEQQAHGYLGLAFTYIDQTIGSVAFNFAGLYDTVSSYHLLDWGEDVELNPDFENDVEELNLNSLGAVNYTLHLTAENELRKNFSLTNINSAGKKGKTIALPGVHSDIGGSYVDGMDEDGIILYDVAHASNRYINAEKKRYIDEGWYFDEEISIDYTAVNELLGNRTNLSNKYSFIPLRYMMKFAKKEGKIEFEESKLNVKFKLNSFLTTVKERLDSYVNGDNSLVLISENTFTTKQLSDHIMLKKLRNKYLHISHHYKNYYHAEPMAARKDGRLIIHDDE